MRNKLIGAAFLSAFVPLIAGGQARAQEATPDTACHKADTLVADLFSGEQVYAHPYAGADAAALYAAVTVADPGDFGGVAATITVVAGPANGVVAFFMYDADGCYFVQVEASTDQATAAFAAAKLIPPFGGINA